MSPRYIAVALCFALSGYAALLYQTAWMRQFAIVFGTSHLAVATVLAAYMAGLAAGAWAISRLVHRIRRPILAYGILEAGIALSALAIPLLLMLARAGHAAMLGDQPTPPGSTGLGQTTFYAIVAFIVLSIPTAFMGATLPLLTRYAVRSDEQVGPRVGMLYGINTLGAVVGALTAGFYLIPALGLSGTVYVGIGANLLVFFVAAAIERYAPSHLEIVADTGLAEMPAGDRSAWMFPLIAISGANAFYLEVLWTRLLNHTFGGTLAAFTTMLATFLVGIAIGGAAGGQFANSRRQAATMFVLVQIAIAICSLTTYRLLDQFLPEQLGFISNVLFAAMAMLPSTFFIGATFPLAVRVVSRDEHTATVGTARVYAWNTLGAIVGAMLAGFVLIPALGFSLSAKLSGLTSLGIALACAMLLFVRQWRLAGLTTGAVLAVLVFYDAPRPEQLLRALADDPDADVSEVFYGVGQAATIMVHEVDGVYQMRSDGLPESTIYRSGTPPSKHSQYWLTALPTIARPDAQHLLMIGLGGGIALEAVPPSLHTVDVIELEQQVVAANESLAALREKDPLTDPRVNIVLNDARSALSLTNKKYDIVVSQPSHPWTAGASHLYTVEFLQLARSRMHDDGVFLQWINAQYIDEQLLRILAATVGQVFDNVRLYQPLPNVLLFLASDAPIHVERDVLDTGRPLAEYGAHYRRIGIAAAEDLVAAIVAEEVSVAELSRNAPLNTDDRNRLATDSRPAGDGLDADSLRQVLSDYDALLQPSSSINRDLLDAIELPYVATQLVLTRFEKRAFDLARSTSDESMRHTIDGIGYTAYGQSDEAQAAFIRAVDMDVSNATAGFSLVKPYMNEIGKTETYTRIRQVAEALPESARAVIRGWQAAKARDWEALQSMDSALSRVPHTQMWYPISVKLRVDWRLALGSRGDSAELGREAMSILDDVLAFYWNFELYMQRAAAALFVGEPDKFLESSWWAAQLVDAKVDKAAIGRYKFSRAEFLAVSGGLQGLAREIQRGHGLEPGSRAASVLEHLEELRNRLEAVVSR